MQNDFEDGVDKQAEKNLMQYKLRKQLLRSDMLDHLCRSKEAHFKSQQIGDPELTDCEKREIAESVLDHNCATFLARFGNFIREEHLDYFDDCAEEHRYETNFYVKRLRTSFNTADNQVCYLQNYLFI